MSNDAIVYTSETGVCRHYWETHDKYRGRYCSKCGADDGFIFVEDE